MKDINDLRRDRSAAAEAMKAAADKIGELGEAGTADDDDKMVAAIAEFATAEGNFKSADAAVKRAEAVEAAVAASATSESNAGGRAGGESLPAVAKNPEDKGIGAAAMVHALANSKGDVTRAVERLEKNGMSGLSAALSGATDSAGGVTIPAVQAAELIELLRPRVTVRASGARTVPMPAGEIKNARQATGATAGYGAENAAIVESEQTFDKVDEKFRKLSTLVPLGNSLLRHTGIAMFRVVRDDILNVMAAREDLGFLRDDGTNGTPVGLLNWALAGQWQASVANTAAAVEAALRKAVSQVEDNDVQMTKCGWIMRASAKNFLASLRDANSGAIIFPSIEASGQLKGFPIRTSSQIPDNLGVGGDETEIYFADFDEIMIGESQSITIASSTEAAYVDQGSNTVSAFQNDLTLMRAIAEHDLAPRHEVAIAGINGAGWTL